MAEPLRGPLLAVHAHPDDETLSTGGLLATWAATGRPVTVVTCTRGERGEVIPAELAHLAGDPIALAAHRERELAAALAALGVADHVFLDQVAAIASTTAGVPDAGAFGARAPDDAAPVRFADSGMAWARPGRATAADDTPSDAFVRVPVEDAAARLAEVIRGRRPDVVVGYEPGGGYGHPDHVHAHRVMRRGVALAADDGAGGPSHRVAVVLWAQVDREALRAATRDLRPDGGVVPESGLIPADPDGPLPSAAVAPEVVDLRVEVTGVLDRVVAALRAHATQVQGVRVWSEAQAGSAPGVGCFALSTGVLEPLLRWESYRVDPGWPPDAVDWPPGIRR